MVWAVGDGADGGEAGKQLVERIAVEGIDRLLYLGDVYDDGTAAEYAHNYAPSYGRFARTTAPTPGNHEWEHRAEGYDAYWRRVTGKTPPAFYAFTMAGWTLLSLNSEAPHDAGSPQLAWLRQQLQAPGNCRIAFWHRPRYSAGKHGDQEDIDPLWQALRGHARIVLNGHDHDMQRLTARDGMTEFVSGAGGKELYGIDPGYEGVAFGDDHQFGALRLVLQAGTAAYSFRTVTGRVIDSGRIRCAGR